MNKIRPDFYPTLAEASQAAQALGIQSREDYRSQYKQDPRLPAYPDRFYSDFIDWFVFLAYQRPFTPENIPDGYAVWAERMTEFLKKARGASSKKTRLCRFVRLFIIEKQPLLSSPEEFLLGKPDVPAYRHFLEQLPADHREQQNNAVLEFLDWVIREYLTLEDEETGERVRINDVRNPFRTVQVEPVARLKPGQTVKSLLPFHHMRKAREWIIPPNASHFRDLKHLYNNFDRDWVPVDASQINRFDPNCVWKEETNKRNNKTLYFLWCPMVWLHLFALMMTGLRGSMISHCDSGEADSEIPDLDKAGKILWVKNPSPMTGLTKRQSVIARYPDDQIGLYTPRNKCGNGAGFYCSWMEEQLAY